MPWTLTTPITVGDLDTGSYAEVKIIRMTQDSIGEAIHILLEYGNTVGGNWESGYPPKDKTVQISVEGSAYQTLVTTHASNDGELTYDATKRGLYEWLNANGYIDAGSIT